MVNTSGGQQFLMLLYKGLLLRKRHYIVTAFEILVPILACSLILLGLATQDGSDYHDPSMSKQGYENATIYPPTDPFQAKNSKKMIYFIYTPDTPIAGKLMDDSIAVWKKNSKFKGNFSKKAMTTEGDMVSFALYADKLPNSEVIGSVFNNFINKKELPKSLDYKIRYATKYESFYTNMKYRMNGPQSYNTYDETYFVSWQAAVGESFILLSSDNVPPYKIMMQRFPYPEHRNAKNQNYLINIIPWTICYGFLIFTINMVRRVTEEKANGSKELLKMMGMTDLVYWLGTFTNYFILGAVLTLIISIVYKIPIRAHTMMLPNTDFFLLLILLLLLMASTILFAFVVTTFIPHRIFSGIFMSVVTVTALSLLTKDIFMPGSNLSYFLLSQAEKLSLCLFPVGATLTIFTLISSFEAFGEGARWSNITQYSASPDINLLMVIGMMIVSCFMYSVVIWYIDAVWPWQYGVTKPFYFPFTKSYWCSNGYQPQDNEDSLESSQSSEFFEEEPTGSTPGVVIKNLVKTFKSGTRNKLAVNNVSLNVYSGQITALLGHNGAGKTTTINILTGLFPPTSGSATIDGWDILTHTTNARRSIGVCPQHNILYDTLTPDEHLKFYAGLKGVKCRDLSEESTKMLNMLRLSDKKNELVKTLSGGMKRKLSLGIALIGGSKVLFLDEPTSGMDPEARRSVWDALLEIRDERTIILTTHYMEEADVLGDRIAIMSEGEVQCVGSSLFLKKKLGTGYKLHIVKDNNFNLNGVTDILQSFIPDASVESNHEKEITYNLSSDTDASLGDLFEKMESSKKEFGIGSFGISVTTMEDVFLNAAKIAELKHKKEGKVEVHMDAFNNGHDKYTRQKQLPKSFTLALNQLEALLIKRFHCSKRSWFILLVQTVLPLIIICMLLLAIRIKPKTEIVDSPPLWLDLQNVYGKTDGFYHSSEDQEAKSFADKNFKKVLEDNRVSFPPDKPGFNPVDYVLQFGMSNLADYLKTFMIGGTFEVNNTLRLTSWYNGEPYHTMPIALNAMHNALLRSVTGTQDSSSISLTNAPLPFATASDNSDMSLVYIAQIAASIMVPMSLSFLAASYAMFPVEERVSKSKLLQLMTGLPTWLYWCGMFIWDACFHAFICILLLIPFAAFDASMYFSHSAIIGSIFLLLLLYGWCSIPFCYVMSFLFKKPNTAFQVILVIYMLTGVMLSSIMTAVGFAFGGVIHEDLPHEYIVAMWVFRLFPSFSVANGCSNIFAIAYSRNMCSQIPSDLLEKLCDSSSYQSPEFKCCNITNNIYPLSWDADKIGREVFFMFLVGILFFMIVLFLETTIPSIMGQFIKKKVVAAVRRMRKLPTEIIRDTTEEDSEVRLEEERIEDLCLRKVFDEESLMVHNLTKIYSNLYAVDNLSFGVHKEECFGLLGVNGAGKTTTFKMITGDVLPSQGNAYTEDINLIQHRKKFQSFLGYCPQYDALLNRLTGTEMLLLFAKLRGLTKDDAEQSVNQLIRMVDLQEHANKLTKHYSGGNKRKLSLALALIGTPPLILLDEPTSGVDPVSRRKIWKVLTQARNNAGAAIILTTHSMEESEALCNRLAIMVNGKFRCLGSLQQLKTKYGTGYTVIIKLKKEELEKPDAMTAEKVYFQAGFLDAVLTDDHQGMLQYHITDTSVPLSQIFKFMENMKRQFNLADYLISGTSLEQIFLAFARAQRASSAEYV